MNHQNHHQTEKLSPDAQQRIRVLHVDDDPAFTLLVKRWFERVHEDTTYLTETDPARALGQIEHGSNIDVVISDYRMPGMNGVELLDRIRTYEPDVPFVMVTGEGDESVASEAIHGGVTDYFTKDEVTAGVSLLVERVRALALQRRAVRESQRFGTLLEILTVPVAVLDAEGRTAASNPLFDELVEAAGHDEETSPQFQTLVSETDRYAIGDYLGRLRDTTGPDLLSVQLAVQAGDESIPYRAQMAAVPGVERVRTGILVVLEPATDETKQFKAMLSDLVEWAAGPYIAVDDDWDVTVVNEKARELFGENERSVIGHSLWEFFPAFEDATFHDQLRAVKRHGTPLDAQVYYAPTGMHFHVRAYRTSTGVAVYLQDVTERVERERELERLAERFQEFAKIVAHDLRNPISTAKGYAGLVAEAGCADEESIAVVESSLERAESIIAQTLNFAEEGQVGIITTVDLESAVAEAWREVEAAWEGVELQGATVEVESTVAIRADASGLTRILGNLLRNCVEHGSVSARTSSENGEKSAETGDLTITVGPLSSSETTVGFYVEDDGPGIPLEARELVFETRYSTSEDGTGFGLAVVEQIAVAHGWSVRVTDGSSGGARFEFTGIDPADDVVSAGEQPVAEQSAARATEEDDNDDD